MADTHLEKEKQKTIQDTQLAETNVKEEAQAVSKKEKTPEELALEAGYYASCFRSH